MADRSEPISWSTAEKVASKVAAREPFSASYLGHSLQSQFDDLTAEAEERVAAETGLASLMGPARGRVVTRPEWAAVNVASMRRILTPVTERMAGKPGLLAIAGRYTTGAELGAILGWMSTRVLGQYDQLLDPDEGNATQDFVYYVGPNLLALEKRYAFPPEEFRLWLALHECAHRAQFTAVPWLTPFFREQVNVLLKATEMDVSEMVTRVRAAVGRDEMDGNPLKGGPFSAVAGPEQRQAMGKMIGLMALLEGHGEVVMAKAGEGRIPNADRFHRVLHERRNTATGITKIVQRLLGMDAKLKQYEQGAAFIRAVEAHGGRELFDRVWSGPDALPTVDEIIEPKLWIDRVGAPALPA